MTKEDSSSEDEEKHFDSEVFLSQLQLERDEAEKACRDKSRKRTQSESVKIGKPAKKRTKKPTMLVKPLNTMKEEILPSLPPVEPPVEPSVEPLVNAAVETATLELVVANGCLVQPRLSFEGGFTKVVNEGTPEFEFLSNTYNEAQDHQDYHHD